MLKRQKTVVAILFMGNHFSLYRAEQSHWRGIGLDRSTFYFNQNNVGLHGHSLLLIRYSGPDPMETEAMSNAGVAALSVPMLPLKAFRIAGAGDAASWTISSGPRPETTNPV
jgi:hypothetical protein